MTDDLRPLRARMETNDEQRAIALIITLKKAEETLGLPDDEGLSLRERAQRILMAARAGRLDPRLYGAAWFVRQTCHTRH